MYEGNTSQWGDSLLVRLLGRMTPRGLPQPIVSSSGVLTVAYVASPSSYGGFGFSGVASVGAAQLAPAPAPPAAAPAPVLSISPTGAVTVATAAQLAAALENPAVSDVTLTADVTCAPLSPPPLTSAPDPRNHTPRLSFTKLAPPLAADNPPPVNLSPATPRLSTEFHLSSPRRLSLRGACPGGRPCALDARAAGRAFRVSGGGALSLSDVAVSNALSLQGSVALVSGAGSSVALTRVAIANSTSWGDGALFSCEKLHRVASIEQDKPAHSSRLDPLPTLPGGALLALAGGAVTATDCTWADCAAVLGTGAAASALAGGSVSVSGGSAIRGYTGGCGGDFASSLGSSLTVTGAELSGGASQGYGALFPFLPCQIHAPVATTKHPWESFLKPRKRKPKPRRRLRLLHLRRDPPPPPHGDPRRLLPPRRLVRAHARGGLRNALLRCALRVHARPRGCAAGAIRVRGRVREPQRGV